jgi:precorrin-6B methylase 2
MGGPPSYRRPLPGLLGSARRKLLLAAWLGRPVPHTINVDGFELLFEEGLRDPRPALGFSLVRFLVAGMDVRPGERLLDLDTGAGWVALAATRAGAEVVAVDHDDAAARCVRRSFLIAGYGEPDVRIGPGLEPVRDEQFDVVAWVPPTLPGANRTGAGHRLVLDDRSRVTEVLNAAGSMLRRGGRLVLPFPDRDATPWLHNALTAAGLRFATTRYAEAPVLGPVRLYRAWVAKDGPPGEVSGGEALSGAGWVLKDR